ncbi:ATP-binding protein [Demequina globuliformis]|uniref:ATP-binding protein n=1 Tax=Demequina globuliformis TaxID=676202 RepID=UPI0007811414|nr:ATP-binding protein [Demequina globuliformis]
MSLYVPRVNTSDDVFHYRAVNKDLLRMAKPLRVAPIAEVQAYSSEERAAYNAERLKYLSRGIVVNTPTIAALRAQTELRLLQNHGRIAGGAGIYMSSSSNHGKTTAIRCVLRDTLLAHKQAGAGPSKTRLPVGLFTMPEVSNVRAFCGRALSFFGRDTTTATPENNLIEQLAIAINRSRMQVVAIDEVHRIDAERDGESVAETIRGLADNISATMILAGINLENHSLLRGEAARQVRTRFFSSPVYDYADPRSPGRNEAWRSLVNGMLRALPLYRLDRAALAKEWRTLGTMSEWTVGFLSLHLTVAAMEKIQADDIEGEFLTIDNLQDVQLPGPRPTTRT